MPRYVEYGVLNAHSLVMLHQLMENVFVPYLNTKSVSQVRILIISANIQLMYQTTNKAIV